MGELSAEEMAEVIDKVQGKSYEYQENVNGQAERRWFWPGEQFADTGEPLNWMRYDGVWCAYYRPREDDPK